MSSSIPAARASLYGALLALTGTGGGLENVAVIRTDKWTTTPESDRVIVQNAQRIQRAMRTAGGVRFEENFTIPVRVEAYLNGDDVDAVETRLWELVAHVERLVVADHTLGGTVLLATPAGSASGALTSPGDDFVHSVIALAIECQTMVDLS